MTDRQVYLEAGLRDLACVGCAALVRVKKNSPLHTSVQWTCRAVETCAEFTARRALGETLVDTCLTLRDTIDGAVRDGRLAPP
jgi:hypothetical protein